MDTRFRKLLEPTTIGRLALKNRIVMPPMGTSLSSAYGEAGLALIEYFAARARGGAGLIFIEATAMAPAIDPLKQLNRMLRLDDDGFACALAEVAEAIHEGGAKVGIQLTPGYSSQARMGPWAVGKYHVEDVLPVGPSGVAHPEVKRPARALEIGEIEKIVELCGYSAAWTKQAGFDMIEIHAHSGFLIGQFLSPYFNHRTDRYGGSPDNRVRFLLDIIAAIHKHAGADFPISVKYSIDEFMEGGRDLQEGLLIAQHLQRAGVNAVTMSAGIHGSRIPSMPSMYYPEGVFIPLAKAIKAAVPLPIILPGRMGNPVLAEQVLEDGTADFIAWGRPLIADPDLPRKVAAGRLDEIRPCMSCNECVGVQWSRKLPVRCTVNPAAGREYRYQHIPPATRAKNVAIVGAGPAGMEAARVAAIKGHHVTLYDQSSSLVGGQLQLASVPPHKDIFLKLLAYYQTVLGKLDNLQVVAGRAVTAEDILAASPDAVVLATGAGALVPDFPGVRGKNVVTAHDLLSGAASCGETVVIVGGGMVGCEVANWLAAQGKKVTIVEMLDAVATDVHTMVRLPLLMELAERGVVIFTGAELETIDEGGVSVVDSQGRRSLKADTVALCLGGKSDNPLEATLTGRIEELFVIGDARQPRHIREAIAEGFVTAYNL